MGVMSTYGNALLRKDGEYPLFDGLGSERTVTNSSQTVTGTLTLDGLGQTVATTGSSTNPYMFGATSGYRTEGDAGLMKVGARYYDAQVGRFITRDSMLSEPPYVYCYGDPVNCVDPSGHSPADDAWALISGLASMIGGLIGAGGGFGFGTATTSTVTTTTTTVAASTGAVVGSTLVFLLGTGIVVYYSNKLTNQWLQTPSGNSVTNWLGDKLYNWGWY